MAEMPPDPAALARSLALAERRVRQLERDLSTAQSMYEQSKRALLRNNDELAESVLLAQATSEELRAARERAEAASVAKSRFLAIVSHEMRTPLNGILGSMELLLGLPATKQQNELVRLTYQSARSLLLIINDVLDFSKAEAGRLQLERVPFDLRECAQAVVDLVANAASHKSLRVSADIAADVPQHVLGDPTRLRQVLLNLMDNAIKFTSFGFVELRVRRAADDCLEFSVADSGIGIRPEALARVFEPFTQEDESTTRRFGGTGLGLAICKRLVALMEGELAVESALGIGSTFRFQARLPAAEAPQAEANEPVSSHRPLLRGARVLLVDDNHVNLVIGRHMLQRLECVVETAENGAEAVARLRAGEFEAVLMDCSMPVMDGFEATGAIRKLGDARARTPIIAMTAYAMSGDREKCLAAGMDDYLTKPVKLSDLIQVLERALNGRVRTASAA